MEFGYHNDLGIGTFTPQYNGNISATKWSANLGLGSAYLNEPKERAYQYTYDPMGRLLEANFNMKVSTWASSSAFREAISYDQNGNILSLYRNNESGSPIDWLVYNYGEGINRSNQLKSVTDQGIITKGFKDKNTSGDDYGYDTNGNMTSDKNKGIENIHYNPYLNLTEEIIKDSGEKVKYIYDADGIKLAEEIYPAGAQSPAKRLDYMGPLVYENDTLKFVVHDEGKIVIPKSPSEDPEYQYQVKDHLGNVRLTFTAKENTDVFTATMEDTGIADYNNPRVLEMAFFDNLFETEIKNVNQWFNHTSNDVGNAIYLDGSEERTIGPYTLMKVYPGDTVKMEVFAKFENKASHNSLPLTTFLMSLFNPLQSATSTVAEGSTSLVSSLDGLAALFSTKQEDDDVPAAYLNYILFDKDLNVANLAFERIDESAGFAAGAAHSVAFQKLELQKVIDRVGYLYVFVSNESPGSRVWMDDLSITYSQSPVVHFEDYYPFGLSIAGTAFERGNEDYKGMITTDGTGLKDLGFRQYDAAIGRFHAVDPLAELQSEQSTYQYAGNNPVSQIDVLGLEANDHDKVKERNKPKPQPQRKQHKDKRFVNGKKVKVKNGFVNKRQTTKGSTQSAQKKKEKTGKQESTASNDKKDSKGSGQATADNNASDQTDQSGDESETNPFKPTKPRTASASLLSEQGLPGMLPGSNQPRFENSVTPPTAFDYGDNNGMSPLAYAANMGDKTTNEEQYRQYLANHFSAIERQALFYRMQTNRNYNFRSNIQATRFNENILVRSNTTTSEDEILDPQQKPPHTSTPAEALSVIPADDALPQSAHFTKVNPNDFLHQLRARVAEGGHEGTNQGAETNFCWAAAIAKHAYDKDPKGMAEAMINLYETGIFVYNNNNGGMNIPEASPAARNAVGDEQVFGNNQDEERGRTINELDQMLFMTLADHYKESINYADLIPGYQAGDEEGLWAGGVLSKATKVWEDFGFDVEVTGADVKLEGFTVVLNIFEVQEAMETNDVVLYVNSDKFKLDEGSNYTATHYIHIESIEQVGGKYEITYWDYGAIHQVTMNATQFTAAVYGMIEIPKTND